MTETMPLELARQRFPPIWVIYTHPTDYPEHFVVRVFWGLTPETQQRLAKTLFEARQMVIAEGACARIERADRDAACIEETWI